MRYAAIPLIIMVAADLVLGQEARGPVAYWPFDEGQGTETRDGSGHDHHGHLRGGATWTEGRVGGALHFNGTDAWVEIAGADSLHLTGDMTFMAWIRTRSDDRRDQLIYGDTAGRAVNRHVTIELDRGVLVVGHGNDVQYESFSPRLSFDEQWMHLAVMFEYPCYLVYVNGELFEQGEMAIPLARTSGAGRALGGWFAGYFQGALDEVRLYDRALSEEELCRVASLPASRERPAAELALTPRWKSDEWVFDALLTRWPHADGSLRCTLTRQGQSQPSRVFSAPLVASRNDSQRARAHATLPRAELASGTYLLTVRPEPVTADPVDRDQERPDWGPWQCDVELPDPPAWLGSRAGWSDTVLPPYLPVEVVAKAGGTDLVVWGRTYSWQSPEALVDQITSGGVPLLRGPMQLAVEVAQRELHWSGERPSVQLSSPNAVSLRQIARAGDLTLQTDFQLEYDGFLQLELQLSARAATELRSLVLDIPLSRQIAQYLYTWPTSYGSGGYSGRLPDSLQMSFHPIVWVGDEERGLSWMCESQNQWAPASADKAIRLVTEADQVSLQIELVGRSVIVKPDEPLTYVMALQATPLKPLGADGWALRFGSCPWYGEDYDLLTERPFHGQRALDQLKQQGVRTLIAWNWTPALAYPGPLQRDGEFRALVGACHQRGIRIIPYLGYQISERAPEYPWVHKEVVTVPLSTNPDKYPGNPSQMVSAVCMRSIWQDALVDSVDRLMREYDIDGVYLDSTNLPFPCMNESHGCVARYLDGTRVPVYPVFAVRDTFRRVYAVVKQYKPDGIVDNHVYDCMNSGALAYATSYWNGEQLAAAEIPTDSLPLDRFRSEFAGVNWGVPGDLLSYKLGSFKKALAVSLPHDVLVRFRQDEIPVDAGESESLLGQAIWKLADDFGRAEALFTPYDREPAPLHGLPDDWIASTYRHKSTGALVIISNLGRVSEHAVLQPDWQRMGFDASGSAVDGLTRAPLPLDNGMLRLTLGAGEWQYVWLQPASR